MKRDYELEICVSMNMLHHVSISVKMVILKCLNIVIIKVNYIIY